MTQRSPADLEAENDALRQLLADSNAACPYCGLAASELAKCSRGFPGCARLDDALNGPYPILDQSEMLEPFEYDNFISVTSTGGNIGRLFWNNQCQLTIETWERGGDPWATLEPPTTSRTSELPGSFALIATIGDWWAWSF